jgi:predicted nucleotidyltransferase
MTPHVDISTLLAAKQFARAVARTYDISEVFLFGSRARGTAHEESDADVAVLLRGASAPFVATKLAMDDIAYDVLLDTGIRIQPLPIWEDEWAHRSAYTNPQLLSNIARDGVKL